MQINKNKLSLEQQKANEYSVNKSTEYFIGHIFELNDKYIYLQNSSYNHSRTGAFCSHKYYL